jgi:hypothetical protein
MRGSRTENDLETSRVVSRAFGEAGAVAVAARAEGRSVRLVLSLRRTDCPAMIEITVHASIIDPIRQAPMGHGFDGPRSARESHS